MTPEEHRSVACERFMPVGAAELFHLITDLTLHSSIDGSATVLGDPQGPRRLRADTTFTMAMQQGAWSYRSTNHVVEYVEDELIAWESTGTFRGRTIIGGQRWRWRLSPQRHGTLVEHSYVWGYARWPLLTVWLPRYPARARRTLPLSLLRLSRIAEMRHRSAPDRSGR